MPNSEPEKPGSSNHPGTSLREDGLKFPVSPSVLEKK